MRICFITDSYPPNIGGAEIVIKSIAEGIYAEGVDVLIITSKPKNKSYLSSRIPDSKIIRIFTPAILQRFWFLLFSVPLILIKGRKCDLLHGTSYGGILPTFIAGKILKKPTVVTIHEFMGKNWKKFTSNIISGLFYETAEKIFARLSFNKFICVSEFTKNSVIEAGAPENRTVTIYNGENNIEVTNAENKNLIRSKLGFNEEDYIFASYGRLGITKGFEYLIGAIPEIIKYAENAKFLLIFTKGSDKIWRNILKNLNYIDKNRFVLLNSLEKKDLFKYLSIADAIVIPSLSEGFGYTTLEAGKMGKRIVASNAGAIPEVIQGEYILFEPGNPMAIKEACIKAFEEKFLLAEVKEFKWEKSIKQYLKIYREILPGNE